MASTELECELCYVNFDGEDSCPRLLSCGHTFCSGCLELLFHNSTRCPTCRVKVKLPQAGVAGLPKNWALLSLIARHEKGEGLPICESCLNKHPANTYCLDCEEDMCRDAARFHTRNKTSRGHHIVPLEPSAVSVKCSKHDEPFRLFDADRGCMICRSCIISSPSGNVVSLVEAGSKCKQKMEELATKTRSRVNAFKAETARVKEATLDMTTSCEEQLALIGSVFEVLRNAITAREQSLMKKVKQLHHRKVCTLKEQTDHLHKCQESIKRTVQSVLSTIQSLDNASLLASSPELESKLVAMEKYAVAKSEGQSIPEFRFSRKILQFIQEAIKKVGIVSDNSTCAETTTADGPGLRRAKPGELGFFTITARDAQNRTRSVGGNLFEVRLISESGEEVSAYVEDLDNGCYLATYTIPAGAEPVDYKLNVRLRGAHIKGSPFTVHIASLLRRKAYKALSHVASKLTYEHIVLLRRYSFTAFLCCVPLILYIIMLLLVN